MTVKKAGRRHGAKVIIGYARVSTDRQGRDGGSLENQESAIRSLAAKLELPVLEVFRDVGTAAGKRSLDDRKGLLEALKACRDNDGLLAVWDWSRLSRHAAADEGIRRLLPRSDCILSIKEGENLEDAARHARFLKAQADRELISRRTKEGMARSKGEGVVFGNPKIKDVQASGAKSMSRKADALVLKIVEILRDFGDHEKLTQQEAADLLNSRYLRTGHGELWDRSRMRTPLRKARAVLAEEATMDRKRMEDDPDFGRF